VELYLAGRHRVIKDNHMFSLVRALAKNKSLVGLAVDDTCISDGNWDILCQSLSRHPTLDYLNRLRTGPRGADRDSNERKTGSSFTFSHERNPQDAARQYYATKAVPTPGECDERILSGVIEPYMHALSQYLGPMRAQLLGCTT
jgi:hypothetical protein